MDLIIDVLLDTLLDAAKLLPILFLTYLIMELVEHYAGEKTINFIRHSKGWGPAAGGLLGILPQCGIAGGAANLYCARVISLGTFVSVMLATSDEMLPILISSGSVRDIVRFLSFKLVFGIVAGFAVDLACRLLPRRVDPDSDGIHSVCEREGCHCEHGVWLPALKHTLRVGILLFVISFLIGLAVELIGADKIAALPINTPVLGEAIASLLGLIPNCSVSVMLTDFYLDGIIGAGPMMAGLLTNGGIGLLVLFRMNHGKKYLPENLIVTALLVVLGFAGGLFADLIF